jgi:hypothetical protein
LDDPEDDNDRTFFVKDERRLRAFLEQHVRDPVKRLTFLEQAANILGNCNTSTLRKFLHPLEISEGVSET